MSHRTALRQAVHQAMLAAPEFRRATAVRGWVQNINAAELPAFSVSTPVERAEAMDKDTLQRTVDLLVVFKREGGELLEDQLDTDADTIEALVAAAAGPLTFYQQLTETQISLAADTGKRSGMVALRFVCMFET